MIRKTLAALIVVTTTFVAAFAEDPSYRLLKFDGHAVRWPLPSFGPLILTYKIVDRPTVTPNSRTCSGGLTSFDELATNSNLTIDAVKNEIKESFRMWEAVANIKFVETNSDTANILLGAQVNPVDWAFADVYYDLKVSGEFKAITKGLVCFNPKQSWKIGFGGNIRSYDLRFTFAHEIGHVLGLDHPADSSNQLMGFRYHERFRSIQAGDAFAASILYGKPVTILVGKP